MIVKIKSLKGTVPEYATSGSAGMDIRAYLIENVVLYPGQRALVPTGLFIELPQGYEAQIRPRSGLAVNNGIGMANGVGTVDSDYRGELKVPLINWGTESFLIQDGDRIAQMIIAKYERINWELVEDLQETVRGTGGFGHTGK
jgi:dUTP pyrophosphatase